jgi:nucleoid-associated protein YgaU
MPNRHVVQRGDNLWLIARHTLAAHSRDAPSNDAMARYWHTLIDANRSTLRSGDPSLIYPGEIVALPPVP